MSMTAKEAANLIDKMSRSLTYKNPPLSCALCMGAAALRDQEPLQAQLAAEKKRADAAVADMKGIARNSAGGNRIEFWCDICRKSCKKSVDWCDAFEWSGVEGAGEDGGR